MKCLECEREVRSINYKHLKSCCGLSPTEYKEKHPGAELMDADVKMASAHFGENNASWKGGVNRHTPPFIRECGCGRFVEHRSIDGYRSSKKKNTCKMCVPKGNSKARKHTDESRKKISDANKGKSYNKSRLGVKETEEAKAKRIASMKAANFGKPHSWTGKKHSAETRNKMSVKRAEMLLERFGSGHQLSPWYNKDACKLFDELNRLRGWNGLHAENGGEFYIDGYWLDYYEPVHNIVIEFDEPRHKIPSHAEKDRIRQEHVTKQLGCRFYRIDAENITLEHIKD